MERPPILDIIVMSGLSIRGTAQRKPGERSGIGNPLAPFVPLGPLLDVMSSIMLGKFLTMHYRKSPMQAKRPHAVGIIRHT